MNAIQKEEQEQIQEVDNLIQDFITLNHKTNNNEIEIDDHKGSYEQALKQLFNDLFLLFIDFDEYRNRAYYQHKGYCDT